jgi:hypothetical protein
VTADLRTEAERSEYVRTGRYDEVVRLAAAFAERWPEDVRTLEYGRTPEGRPLLALIVTRSGCATPAAARDSSVPVVLVQCAIHAGECDGKDAGFRLLRDLLETAADNDPLRRLVVLFVPVVNPDGHERFGPWHRANQAGPEETGRRANARNLDLNRDYTKLDTPEIRALLAFALAWDPLCMVDLHVANGADFEHDVSVQVEPYTLGAPALHARSRVLRDEVLAGLRARGRLPLPFYPELAVANDPSGGFVDLVFRACYATGYWPHRNRYTVLVEAHAWKPYAHRVAVAAEILDLTLRYVAREAAPLLDAVRAADRDAAALGGLEVPIEHELAPESRPTEFRGYRYRRVPSEISGALMTVYEPSHPDTWRVTVCDRVVARRRTRLPKHGYVVTTGFADVVAPLLDGHGLHYTNSLGAGSGTIESFRIEDCVFDRIPVEGRQRVTVRGRWVALAAEPAPVSTPCGLWIPIDQPGARLLAALLEPESPDSLLAWGAFNACFERKEYMEAYVAERVAREMLRDDPGLQAEFAARLEHPAFRADPAARLEFFHRRHASWETAYLAYPILRVTD